LLVQPIAEAEHPTAPSSECEPALAMGPELVGPGPSSRFIHPIAGKGNSQKSISTILHRLPLWERSMAYFSALELVARHTIWEQ
jgi:hypothetical protein